MHPEIPDTRPPGAPERADEDRHEDVGQQVLDQFEALGCPVEELFPGCFLVGLGGLS